MVRAMPVPVQTSRSYPPQVVVTSARRQRFLRRVATVVTALAAFIAVLVVSIISLALGLTWGEGPGRSQKLIRRSEKAFKKEKV